ncbi:beta-lactamase family protein [Xylaria arbuscula]|nr:beta-lactamase family protein [Xylaria arbuscula]
MASVVSDARQTKLRSIINSYVAGDSEGKTGKIPGLLYVAFREDGKPLFEHYAGKRGISSPASLDKDTVFWLASFTKLICSVACMQLVEQGKLSLDDGEQIELLSPELRHVKVLTRGANGEYALVEKERRTTLRMLLSHTAGFGYAFEDERLADYGRPVGFDDFCGERSDFLSRPLVNQPGTTFQYGTSMDWVGVLIERVSGLTLEDYFQKNVLGPLGINSVSFFPSEESISKLAYMHRRAKDGSISQTDHLYRKPLLPLTEQGKEDRFCAGGHGCFGKPADIRKLIAIFLNDGVDAASGARLLKKETIDEMFKDQIPHTPRYSNEIVPVAKPHLANPTPLSPMPP